MRKKKKTPKAKLFSMKPIQLNFLSALSPTTQTKPRSSILEIYTDGASRGNPGLAGAGIHIIHNNKTVAKIGFALGKKTNNQAEYLALALGVLFAKQKTSNTIKFDTIKIFSDSELLIKQMNGLYKVKNQFIKQIKALIDKELASFTVTFQHILREKNTIADSLANKGIDAHKPIPQAFQSLLKEVLV